MPWDKFEEVKNMSQNNFTPNDVAASLGLTKKKAAKLLNVIHVWLLHCSGLCDTEIAEITKMSRRTIVNYRQRLNLQANFSGRPRKEKRAEDYFNSIKLMAENNYTPAEIAQSLRLNASEVNRVIHVWLLYLSGLGDEEIGNTVGASRSSVCKLRKKLNLLSKKLIEGENGINSEYAKFYNYTRSVYRQHENGVLECNLSGNRSGLPMRIRILDNNKKIPPARFTDSFFERLMQSKIPK